MSSPASSAAFKRSLYRSILRLHRRRLPSDMRALGDSYVRQEWRQHMQAPDHFVSAFLVQWQGYEQQLLTAPTVGRDLSPDERNSLSAEQQAQLQALQHEAKHVGKKQA